MQRSSQLALLLTAVLGLGLCQETRVTLRLPDDDSFRNYSFGYLSISGVHKIDSLGVSSEHESSFDIDKSGASDTIAFRSNLTAGASYVLTATAESKNFLLRLNVERIPTAAIRSAVFLTGPPEAVTALLNKLSSSTRLISRVTVNESTTEAAVQVSKPGSSAGDFLPLWEAYDWLRNASAGSGVQLMPDRCPKSPGQLCRCRLTFAAGHPAVHPATVTLNRGDNLVGFHLVWEPQTVEEMHREACEPGTCLNGGSCDPSFAGVGFRCNCPAAANTPWGPRCEHPTRSYTQTRNQSLSFTRHWIGDLPHSAQSLELSFEFSGVVQSTTHEILVLKSSSNPNQPLIAAKFHVQKNSIDIEGKLLSGKNISLLNDRLNTDNWFVIHILVTQNKTDAVLCPRNFPRISGVDAKLECFYRSEATNLVSSIDEDFHNFWLEIGRGLKGCIQSVSVNGYSVDLAAAREVNGDGRIGNFCDHQSSTCGRMMDTMSNTYACGDASVCYGILTYDTVRPMECNCKCLGSKRKLHETIKKSQLCRANIGACVSDPWVISTRSPAESSWSLNGNRSLPLPSLTTLAIEAEIRTRESQALQVLKAVVEQDAGRMSSEVLKVSGGMMQLCTDSSADCLPFPPIRVDDGEWHSVSAEAKRSLVILSVDGVRSVATRSQDIANVKSLRLSAAINNSCLRNIRVSGIYMSTNNSDVTEDLDGTDVVVPLLAADAIVRSDGVDPAPACESLRCPATERCVRQWGKATCECRSDQERNSVGACVAASACKRFSITCPSGGSCEASGVSPGFQCVCPRGVTSRLCVPAPDVSTPAPAMAGFQWWIGLIIGIVLLLLLALVLLLLLVCRRRSSKASEEDLEIDKVHEGMGTDNENDGAPPEDYQGPLSLCFPPQKSAPGSLPDFQPVVVAASAPGAVTEQPATAAAAATPEPKDFDAGGDETLNYGYEDTRDDDAADLDQVSLVSADTDYSFDLKPTLEAWGPKFQTLTDILT